MSDKQTYCELCGEPMPEGETMFKFHGYSGPCPKPPLPKPVTEIESLRAELTEKDAEIARLREGWAKLSLYADEGWAVFQHIRRQAAEGKYGDKLRNEIIAPQVTGEKEQTP